MDSDVPGDFYPREMLSKGTYQCVIKDSVFTGFDRNAPVIEKSPFDPTLDPLKVIYEISRLPTKLQSKTDPNYSKSRKISSVYIEGNAGKSVSHLWTDRGNTENAGRMALKFDEDNLTLGHGGYGNESGFYLTLKRVYKEDWQGFAVIPISDALLTTLLTCKRKIIVGE